MVMLTIFRPMKKLLMCALVATSLNLSAQPYPKDYFQSPMDITLKLAGNFGELRPDHFHAGIDITTSGVEGLPVRASAEGYVSRIKVSPWGYGKAIYITHPNGYTTVYAHLSAYTGAIATWVEKQHYLAESFEIDLKLQPGELPVAKGQQIAASGNTGGSGGPHLHFEIRDTKTEEALNPLLFGLPVQDNVAPTPVTLAVYAAGENAYVNGDRQVKKIPLVKSGSKYVIQNVKDSIIAFGDIGFGIEAYDKESIPHGKNGVYGITLKAGGKIVYQHHLERISFDESRYINCFVDYAEHERTSKYFQLSFLAPNNELQVYDSVVNRGYVTHDDGKYHWYNYEIIDAYGNKAIVEFRVRALTKNPVTKFEPKAVPFIQVMMWNATNTFEEDPFTFEMPEKSVYRNTDFKWTSTPSTANRLSPTISLNDRFTPLHKICTLTIAMPQTTEAPDKLVVCREKVKGGIASVGGVWNGKGMTAQIKVFGKYFVMRDTVDPTIRPFNFDAKGKTTTDFSALSSIQFKIDDNLSGVKTYRGTIDGKWVLFEYDAKNDKLKYTFDEHVGKGQHELLLVVTDAVGNEARFTRKFIR